MNPRPHDWVAGHAQRRPSAPALTGHETGETFTWAELEARVASLAHAMVSRYGLRRGDRVALVAETGPVSASASAGDRKAVTRRP